MSQDQTSSETGLPSHSSSPTSSPQSTTQPDTTQPGTTQQDATQQHFSRRHFLQTLGAGTLTGVVAATANTTMIPGQNATASAAHDIAPTAKVKLSRPESAEIWITNDPDLHVLRRFSFGPTPETVAHIREIGRDDYFKEQLAYKQIDDSEMDTLLAHFSMINMTSKELFDMERTERNQAHRQLIYATMLRAIYSKRQLYELMVDFWTNHFNMYISDGAVKYYKITDDREVIRKHAMGKFSNMLLASAQSPAMLSYLDNASSTKTSPNENYGRELLELHTVSEEDGYTEEDVRNAAYCLTGWGISGQTREFIFRSGRHYTGPLKVKEWESPGRSGAEAVQDGIDLLNYLAHHENTAHYLAHKLCVRFLGENPPANVVNAAAKAYLNNDTRIKPMLRVIYNSASFFQPEFMNSKFRRPFDFMAAAMRVYNMQLTEDVPNRSVRVLHNEMTLMGQPLFGWPPPTGYPDAMGAWMTNTAMLARWNFIQKRLTGNQKHTSFNRQGMQIDYLGLLNGVRPINAGQLVNMLASRLLFQPIDAVDQNSLLGYMGLYASDEIPDDMLVDKISQLAGLILNSPYFQFR
ncbi:MAG: DUF1800 domain-containing protein [Chloroflexota bacterium]